MPLTFAAVIVLGIISVLLMLRISRFRRSAHWAPPGHKRVSFNSGPFVTWMDFLDAKSYEPEGQRLLPWLWLSFVLLVLAIAATLAAEYWSRISG